MAPITFTDCAPIFVVGAGRSGTTLLQLMLNAHPNIAVWGEVHFFDQVLRVRKTVGSLGTSGELDQFLSRVRNTYSYRHLPQADQVFASARTRFESAGCQTYEEFYRYALEEYARAEGKTRFGEKTPANIRYLAELITIFPKAKIIHIVRDPRDVVASFVKMQGNSNAILSHAFTWKLSILFSLDFPRSDASYMELHYENLVSSPEAELTRVCRFIGEEYDQGMLTFYKTAKSHIKDEPWKDRTSLPVSKSSVANWRSEFSNQQAFLIEKIVGARIMDQLGYQRSRMPWSKGFTLPLVFLRDLVKHLTTKYSSMRLRNQDPDIIVSEKKKLYKMLFRSISWRPRLD